VRVARESTVDDPERAKAEIQMTSFALLARRLAPSGLLPSAPRSSPATARVELTSGAGLCWMAFWSSEAVHPASSSPASSGPGTSDPVVPVACRSVGASAASSSEASLRRPARAP